MAVHKQMEEGFGAKLHHRIHDIRVFGNVTPPNTGTFFVGEEFSLESNEPQSVKQKPDI